VAGIKFELLLAEFRDWFAVKGSGKVTLNIIGLFFAAPDSEYHVLDDAVPLELTFSGLFRWEL
jgi:hypothetical protein